MPHPTVRTRVSCPFCANPVERDLPNGGFCAIGGPARDGRRPSRGAEVPSGPDPILDARMATAQPSTRTILRVVLVVVAVALGLYLLYLVRRPLGWVVVATFLAVAMAGPVNFLERRMRRRGPAIGVAYVTLLLTPILLGLIVVPPIVREGTNLADNAPRYAADAREYVEENRTLRKLEEDYQVLTKVEEEARKLPGRIGDAASALGDIGVTVVNSLFAGITILVLSIFMVGSGPRWVRRALALQPPERAERVERTLQHMAAAVGNFVAGALAQAVVCGVLTFIVLSILGVPFAAPLAVLSGLFDLIPLVGATIGAVIVGIVTLFADFPIDLIVWVIWAVVYQQLENTVIQPQIQRRAVNVHPFVVLVSVLFGSTLFGIAGALMAIPVAASLQIAVGEWWDYRREQHTPPPITPPPARSPGAATPPP
jgi:predicted PurR-regulated permease PerM